MTTRPPSIFVRSMQQRCIKDSYVQHGCLRKKSRAQLHEAHFATFNRSALQGLYLVFESVLNKRNVFCFLNFFSLPTLLTQQLVCLPDPIEVFFKPLTAVIETSQISLLERCSCIPVLKEKLAIMSIEKQVVSKHPTETKRNKSCTQTCLPART